MTGRDIVQNLTVRRPVKQQAKSDGSRNLRIEIISKMRFMYAEFRSGERGILVIGENRVRYKIP